MRLKEILIIYQNCKVRNPSKKRYLSEKFVIFNILVKYITFLPAYFLTKIKISPDFITILSFFFVPLGCYFLIFQNPIMGGACWIIFGILDSLDGDMARLSKKKTFYGETIDSMGADIFYFLAPTTVGLFLFNIKIDHEIDHAPIYLIIVGFLISFFLIFSRYMGSKRYILSLLSPKINQVFYNKEKIKNLKKLKLKTSFIENEVLRGNFFSEPGMILNFFVLIYYNQTKLMEFYLIILLSYHFILFSKTMVSLIVYFINIK